MKIVASLLFLLAAPLACTADSVDDPEEAFLAAYDAFQEAENLEMSKSTADAIQKYREADKLLWLIREKHPEWNKRIVVRRVQVVAAALKRLVPDAALKVVPRLEFTEATPAEVLRAVSNACELTIIYPITANENAKVTISVSNIPVEAALTLVGQLTCRPFTYEADSVRFGSRKQTGR